MAIQISSGLRDYMLVTGSFKAGLDGGVLRIYSGTPPATADADASGNPVLCVISDNATGGGLHFETAVTAGVLSKSVTETWRGAITQYGIATFFRFVASSDTDGISTTARRVQGTVAVLGGDINFSNTEFVPPNYRVIDSLNVTLPLV
jgi:hypothetical protein